VSGQLASWVDEHAQVDTDLLKGADVGEKAVVDVVRALALASYPDGTSAYAPTWDELAHRTRTSRSTVAAALKLAVEAKLLSVDRPGRGRGNATVYRVHFTLCRPVDACQAACKGLATAQAEKVQQPDPFQAPTRSRKGPAGRRKGPGGGRKGPAAGPTTETEERHPSQGGAVPPPESNARAPLRSAASGSAARSAPQEPARSGDAMPGLPNLAPVPAEAWAALGKALPSDGGERFESREHEEREKRRRAQLLLVPSGPDPPCADCPEGTAV